MLLQRLCSIQSRVWFLLVAIAAFGLVGGGFVLQDMYRLSPCPLCIFQRLLYVVLGAVALLGFIFPAAGRLVSGGVVLISLGGAATAAYQTWMQVFPELAKECSFTDPNLIERLVDWLGMQWPSLFLATGFCTSRDWEFLGLSLANWSLVAFSGFMGLAIFLLRKKA